jgi:hypothetical protein
MKLVYVTVTGSTLDGDGAALDAAGAALDAAGAFDVEEALPEDVDEQAVRTRAATAASPNAALSLRFMLFLSLGLLSWCSVVLGAYLIPELATPWTTYFWAKM